MPLASRKLIATYREIGNGQKSVHRRTLQTTPPGAEAQPVGPFYPS